MKRKKILSNIRTNTDSESIAFDGLFSLNELSNRSGYVGNSPTSIVGVAGNAQISLSWTAPNDIDLPILQYLIEYKNQSTTLSTVTNSSNTSFLLSNLSNNVLYSIRIAAITISGISKFSNTFNFTPTSYIPPSISGLGPLSGDGTQSNPYVASVRQFESDRVFTMNSPTKVNIINFNGYGGYWFNASSLAGSPATVSALNTKGGVIYVTSSSTPYVAHMNTGTSLILSRQVGRTFYGTLTVWFENLI
jgi:hypothetical protein